MRPEVARRLLNIEELEYSLATDDEPYEAACQSRFSSPEIVAVLGDVIRRLRLLKGTRAAIGRKGFGTDLKTLSEASAEDFMEALNIAKPSDCIGSAMSRPGMPAKVKTALRTLLLSTSDVPGTEGRKTALRFNGHGNNLKFGAASFFVTPNFADTYSPLVLQLHEGPGKRSHLDIRGASQRAGPDLRSPAPTMPSLERMHQIVAADPRAQAKFFLLMTELHYRYIIGVERLFVGRATLARQAVSTEDDVAASLQPCVAPATTDVQAPFEAQGRGFTHGHGKGHSVIGPTMAWLRSAAVGGLRTAARKLRTALLSTAETVQYEAANEPARQLGLPDVAPEPFTARQQRQSRMDGGEEEDGTLREEVPLGPPVEQPHVVEERARAAAENRMPAIGAAAYRGLPLTGAFQSTFPSYRQRTSFGQLGGAPQPAMAASHASLFETNEDGSIQEIVKSDGLPASVEEINADADAWAVAFSHDFFCNICSNHEHDCTETCVKYVKKKLEAKAVSYTHLTLPTKRIV